ncbi:hypothetical protein MRX96_013062 [Rhipicephalus microplus]
MICATAMASYAHIDSKGEGKGAEGTNRRDASLAPQHAPTSVFARSALLHRILVTWPSRRNEPGAALFK